MFKASCSGHSYSNSYPLHLKKCGGFLCVIVYPERVLGGIKDAVNGNGIMWGKFVEDDIVKFTDYPVADIVVRKRPGSRHFFKLGKCVSNSCVKFFTEAFLLFVVIVNTIFFIVDISLSFKEL